MKSAYEVAMEKLAKKDAEEGVESTGLNETQKNEIAEIRSFYKAKLAEREILHQGDIRKVQMTGDPEAIRKVEEDYRMDRTQFEREMEEKVLKVRKRD